MSDFHGLPTGILENIRLRLAYLKTAGPRILWFSLQGGPNLLAEVPESALETRLGVYHFRGGHRLWCAPESIPDTYAPDNEGLEVEEFQGGVRLCGAPETATGIIKTIEIQLSAGRAAVRLRHEIRNTGRRAVHLAPWTLTMLRTGGTAILPQPGGNDGALGLLPNRILSLWPYASINDPRLVLRDDFILIHASAIPPHFKIGYYDPSGRLDYWLDGVLFRKTFDIIAGATYPDGGCNAEIYCDDNVIELESLGALTTIEPGYSAVFNETWELFDKQENPFLPLREIELQAEKTNLNRL
ncbi:MAG: hypothetical protein WCE68_17440 [Anaerolineales bacterium]